MDKARNVTQKHIELLGQYAGSFSSSGGKVDASNDPYVIQRGINHRLHKQVLEENNNRNDLLAVQDSFQKFEAHLIQTIQQAMVAFLESVGGQAERQRAMYTDMVTTSQKTPLDFEFKGFVQRNSTLLIDPSTPQRDVSRIGFPNQNHPATKPLIAGTLERKSRALGALKGYSSGYYVITPSKYLHEFKDDDDVRKDPTPELSLYLPDCLVGAIDGTRFNVKGKDASKGKVGSVLATSHEVAFQAPTPTDAEQWWNIIRQHAESSGETPGSTPVSPVDSRNVSGQGPPPPEYQANRTVAPVQTQGFPQGQVGQTPVSSTSGRQPFTPTSAGGAHGTAAHQPLPPGSGVGGAPGKY